MSIHTTSIFTSIMFNVSFIQPNSPSITPSPGLLPARHSIDSPASSPGRRSSGVFGVQRASRPQAKASRQSTSPRHAITRRSRPIPTRDKFDYNFAFCAIEDGSTVKHSTDFIRFVSLVYNSFLFPFLILSQSATAFEAGLHDMSYDILCLAYKTKLLAKQSIERERHWWSAKAGEYRAISRYLKHSQLSTRK